MSYATFECINVKDFIGLYHVDDVKMDTIVAVLKDMIH